MIHLKRYEDWGVLDFLVLPGFRERTFQEGEGRLRTPLVVDTDRAEYESSDEDRHVDFATEDIFTSAAGLWVSDPGNFSELL